MKKILMVMLLATTLTFAQGVKVNIAKAAVVTVLGAVFFPTIILGDIQYGLILRDSECSEDEYIYTIVPNIKRNDWIVLDFKLNCKEWEVLGTGENIKEKQ